MTNRRASAKNFDPDNFPELISSQKVEQTIFKIVLDRGIKLILERGQHFKYKLLYKPQFKKKPLRVAVSKIIYLKLHLKLAITLLSTIGLTNSKLSHKVRKLS